jgi:hypothetical protein
METCSGTYTLAETCSLLPFIMNKVAVIGHRHQYRHYHRPHLTLLQPDQMFFC